MAIGLRLERLEVPQWPHERLRAVPHRRRSGLSVSAVRFYVDTGLIEPTDLNEA